MKAILFYLFFAVNWVITLLPLRVLYLFSYPFYVILAWLPGYRKDVIMKNLARSFPGKSEKELKKIRSKFYLHFADLVIESLKLQHMSASELKKRYRINNPELLDRLNSEGRSAIAVFGHYGNWEWIIVAREFTSYKFLTVYKPLGNKYFDNYLLKLRSKYGMKLVPMANTLREIVNHQKEGIPTITALVSDQTPPKREIQYWTRFLNQDTPVYLGIEKLSTRFNLAVLFFRVRMKRRGYYTIDIETISEDPASLREHEITELHVKKLEEQIIEQPEIWLWSHRRWKHKKPAANG
ncbi:MAG: lysophospholipid acyltransferase family protein [Bacteroidales bacterium]